MDTTGTPPEPDTTRTVHVPMTLHQAAILMDLVTHARTSEAPRQHAKDEYDRLADTLVRGALSPSGPAFSALADTVAAGPPDTAALDRLLVIAQRHSGQSRKVADFLLAWWNTGDCGGWDPTDLWGVDDVIAADMLTVVHLIRDKAVYPDTLGYKQEFVALTQQWRPTRDGDYSVSAEPGTPETSHAVEGWAVNHPLSERAAPGDHVRIMVGGVLVGPYTVSDKPGRTPDHLVLRNPANGVLFEHYWDPYNTYPPADTPPERRDPGAEYPMTGADVRDSPGTPPVTPTTVGVSVGF